MLLWPSTVAVLVLRRLTRLPPPLQRLVQRPTCRQRWQPACRHNRQCAPLGTRPMAQSAGPSASKVRLGSPRRSSSCPAPSLSSPFRVCSEQPWLSRSMGSSSENGPVSGTVSRVLTMSEVCNVSPGPGAKWTLAQAALKRGRGDRAASSGGSGRQREGGRNTRASELEHVIGVAACMGGQGRGWVHVGDTCVGMVVLQGSDAIECRRVPC